MNPGGQLEPATPGGRGDRAGRSTQPSRRFDLTSVARLLLLLAPWVFIAYLFRDPDAVRAAFADASLLLVGAGLLVTIPGLAGAAWLWARLVGHLSRGLGTEDTPHLLRAFARSWLARYLPGKLWSYGARVIHTDATVAPRRILATSLVYEFALIIGSATALGLGLWTWSAAGPAIGVPMLAAGVAALVAGLTRLDRLVALMLRFLARVIPERWRAAAEEMQRARDPDLGLRAAALFTGGYLLTDMILGGAFVLVVMSVSDIGMNDFPLLVGGYNLAAVVGILAFIAPAGLGVREGVLAGFLAPVVGGPVAASLAILIRVIVVVADLLFIGMVEAATAFSGRNASAAGLPGLGREAARQRPES